MATTSPPAQRRGPLIWRRPGSCSVPPSAPHLQLGADPRTTITVSWSTFGPVERPTLELARGEIIPATSRVVAGSPTVYHHAVATQLEPDGIEQYRLAHVGATGRPRTLQTAPATARPFTFTAFGDQGVSDQAVAVSSLVRRLSPAFHLHAGDLCYADPIGIGAPGPLQHGNWDIWLTMISASLAEQAPWMPVVGNHEIEAGQGPLGYDGFLARFSLPANGAAGTPTTWSTRYGNVAVFGLDSNDVSYEVTVNTGFSGGAQERWLDEGLAAARRDPTVEWIVVVFHHCAYSTNALHGSDAGVRSWVPLFDRHQVDLVINGHNHCYERTHPLRGGTVAGGQDDGGVDTSRGTVYVTAGAGGAEDHDDWIDHGSEVCIPGGQRLGEPAPWSARRSRGPAVLAVDVDPGTLPAASTMRLRALRPDGSEIERVTLRRGERSGDVHPAVATPPTAVQDGTVG